MIKKIIIFVLCISPWFISNLLPLDYNYFNEINTPFFTPPRIFYPIAWTIIYILISITTYAIFTQYKLKDIPISYKLSLLINYIFNQSFTIIFFGLKNNFLGFISCFATFISCLFLYKETQLLQSKLSKLFYPYIALSIFATILSLSIYLMNI